MKKRIPLFKVAMDAAAIANVRAVLRSGYISQGSRVDSFEAALRDSLDAPVLTVNSGTSALDLALHLAGVGPGDYCISTPMTCTATNSVIVNRGAKILWADVDYRTGLISASAVETLMSRFGHRVRAIMAVDWCGAMPDYKRLKLFGVPVIEDAAHRFPVRSSADDEGVYGDYVCYSFQAIKFLTCGDGGAIVVPPSQHERAKKLRWFGLDRDDTARSKQLIEESGYKYHMNDVAAAIGVGNFDLARMNLILHQVNAQTYDKFLARPSSLQKSHHWIYTITHSYRDRLIAHLDAKGIEAAVVHDRNDKHPAFRRCSSAPFALDGVEQYARDQVSIPVGWWVTDAQVQRIANLINKFEP